MTVRPVLRDSQRFPLTGDLRFLHRLRQDEHAPRFNFSSGDRLNEARLERVRTYAEEATLSDRFWPAGTTPPWLDAFVARCVEKVPAYRGRSTLIDKHPSTRREDLRRAPADFVSDDAPIEDLLVYSTSGTTGPPLDVLFDAVTAASYLVHLEQALAPHGVRLEQGGDRVAIALICAQAHTLTYASLSQYLDGAGVLKINLNPAEWTDPADRKAYLERWQPAVLTGDPIAFSELAALDISLHPAALVSSAMALEPGVRAYLEQHFGCPVLDTYSLTECRMIAVGRAGGHELLRHDLFLEILHPERDEVLPPGRPGEICVTGGSNPFLPLIRYRTGDRAALEHRDGRVLLTGLTGRQPVRFYRKNGSFINNVDVARALAPFALPAFCLRQRADHSLVLNVYARSIAGAAVREALEPLFGKGLPIEVHQRNLAALDGAKVLPYIQELP